MQRLSLCGCHILSVHHHLNTLLPLFVFPLFPLCPSQAPLQLLFSSIYSHNLTPSPFPSLCLSFALPPLPPLFSSSSAPPPLSSVYCSRKASTDTSMCAFVHVCTTTADPRASLIRANMSREVRFWKTLPVHQALGSKHWFLIHYITAMQTNPLKSLE